MLHALIMAGGGGTRFWPRSRQKLPKQFLTLVGEGTLIQQAQSRVEAQVPPERTWVTTAQSHQDEVIRQLGNIPAGRVIGVPKPVRVAPHSVQVQVQTDGPTLLVLVVDTEDGWRVAGYDRS